MIDLFYILIGLLLGTITGLIPGIHPNSLVALTPFLFFDPIGGSILLISAAVTHTFLDYIPSIFLGAPNDDTALSVLPGHEMLKEGKGLEAIALTVMGGLGSIIILILLIPLITRFLPSVYEWLRPHIHILLGLLSIWMISKGRWAFVIFILSGVVGFVVLEMHFLGAKGFLPMFSGFFGIPTLIFAVNSKIVKQSKKWTISKKEFLLGGLFGTLSGIFMGIMPGLGSAQASAFVKEIMKDKRAFLLSSGAINTTDAIISVLALWLIGNPRSGVAVAIGNLINLNFNEVFILLLSIIIVSGIASILTIRIAKAFSNRVHRINYRKISIGVIIFLLLVVILTTSWRGIILLTVSSFIGIICNIKNVNRSTMMASIIVPIVIFFAGV